MKSNINNLVAKVDKFSNHLFEEEVSRRRQYVVVDVNNAEKLLEHLSYLIAYSQNAKSDSVRVVIDNGSLSKALCDFRLQDVVALNPCDVIEEHWEHLKGIRQQTKIFQIVMLARKLNSNEKLSENLTKPKIPKELHHIDDIEHFWTAFNLLKKELKLLGVPFFREATSLLHYLNSLGYDCIKPDSAAMKAAKSWDLLTEQKKEISLEKRQRELVETIQKHSVETRRKIPPSVLDLYLLIAGGQRDARRYVASEFYT